jgi:hypothetical protein
VRKFLRAEILACGNSCVRKFLRAEILAWEPNSRRRRRASHRFGKYSRCRARRAFGKTGGPGEIRGPRRRQRKPVATVTETFGTGSKAWRSRSGMRRAGGSFHARLANGRSKASDGSECPGLHRSQSCPSGQSRIRTRPGKSVISQFPVEQKSHSPRENAFQTEKPRGFTFSGAILADMLKKTRRC